MQSPVYATDFLHGGIECYTWKEGVGNWAYYSAQLEYESEEEVRESHRGYIVEEVRESHRLSFHRRHYAYLIVSSIKDLVTTKTD